MKKRIFSLLLVLTMVLGMLPAGALAVSVSDNVIDITDINVVNAITYGSVTISGATVVSAEETGSNTLNVVLDRDTASGKKLNAKFNIIKQQIRDIQDGTSCTLNADGEGTMNIRLLATPNGQQVVGEVKYTIHFSVLKGEAVEVELPTGEGFTCTGKDDAYVGSNYSFSIALAEGYKAGADFAVKVNGETVGTAPGSYTVENVSAALTITVEGVLAKESFAVTLPTGEAYTVSGAASVWEGANYSFAVALTEGYKVGADFAVKVNGETVGTAPGSFTVESVSNDLTITVEGIVALEKYTVTLPTEDGITVSGKTVAWEGGNYTFSVSLDSNYKLLDNFAVKVNGETLGTTPGSFTVENVNENLTVTVEGFAAKEILTVSVPTGEGFTFTGSNTVMEHESYTFTVSFHLGYVASENFCIKVNGETVGTAPGSFTVNDVTENLVISVEGLEIGAEPTVVLSGGRKPHSSWGYVDKIIIDQVQVEEFVWIGDHAYITLDSKTADNATAKVTFVTGGSRPGAMPDTLVELVEGLAEKNFTQKTTAFNYTWNFTLHFSNVGFVPTLASGVESTAATTVYTGDNYSLDLDTIFSDLFGKEMTYSVKVDGGEYTPVDGSVFTLPCTTEGTKVLTFVANNGKLNSEDTYTVTLTTQNLSFKEVTVLVPEGYTPIFYTTAGFDASGAEQLGEALETVKGETTDGFTAYTVTVDSLAEYISVRVEGWGGMAITSVADSTVTLRPVVVTMADSLNNVVAGSYTIASDGKLAASGDNGRFMLAVGLEYTMTTTPSDTTNYQAATSTYTLAAGTEIDDVNALVSFKNLKKIVTPAGATAQLFRYNQYYSNTEFACLGHQDNGNGTITHYFAGVTIPTGGGTTIYRVTYQDYIVKAGWSDATSTVSVTYSDSDMKSNTRVDYSEVTSGNKDLGDDSLMLNVNSRNFLSLSVNRSYTLKAYRTWEIIPVSYNNWIIEPDFHFNVIWESEEGVVSLSEVSNPMTGGESWRKVTGSKEGVAIIEVTYDAIDVRGSTSWNGVYGASDPARTGLVVVQVGGSSDDSVDFGIQCYSGIGTKGTNNISFNPNAKRPWDAEFDTLYFTGSSGSLQLTPTASGNITEVAVSNDNGATWNVLTATEGTYTANIVSGNNILRVTTENGTSYQVVRGDKVTYTVTEIADESDGDGIIEAGETVCITLDGLHTPIPKMAGNYNPGYGGNNDGYSNVHINYSLGETAVWGPGAQYTFHATANYIEITIPADAQSSIALTKGYIGVGVMGLTNFTDGGDSHRNIPDGGCGTRASVSTWHTRSILPEITVTLGEAAAENNPPKVRADAPTAASLELSESVYTYSLNLGAKVFTDDDSTDTLTYTVSVNGGEAASLTSGLYTMERPEPGTYTLLFTATDGKATAEHTVTLTVTKATTPDPGPGNQPSDGVKGYVYVSFEDKGIRVAGETGVDYPTPLGTIVPATAVPFYEGDTIADVTLRLLDMNGITYSHSGTTKENFYLGAISNFAVGGVRYESFGEFDAGQGSGWMITWGGQFINMGASSFLVQNGDTVRWQYTCQYGKDIGDPYWGNIGTTDSTTNSTTTTEQEKPAEPTAVTFADVKANDYFHDAVKWAVETGITTGTSATTFNPDAVCTRAQMVTFLWRAAGSPEPSATTHSFTDADESAYWYKALLWAVETGITTGTSETTFSPDAVCTRAQMAVLLHRSANSPAAEGNHTFADVAADAYYGTAVLWAAAQGITQGTGADAFSPDAACTRAQMVTFLYRHLKK